MIEEPIPTEEELSPFIELGQMLPELCSALRVIEKVVPILAKATHPEPQQGKEEGVYIDNCIRAAIEGLGHAVHARTEKTMRDRLLIASMCIHLVEHWDDKPS